MVWQSQLLSWQLEQRLEWFWAYWQEALTLFPKDLRMVSRLLEENNWNSHRSHWFSRWLHFKDHWIMDQLPRSKCVASDNGSRHIHGWPLSEEQTMNRERWYQTCRNQSDLYHIMICLAVAITKLLTCWWFCLHPNFSRSLVNYIWRVPQRGKPLRGLLPRGVAKGFRGRPFDLWWAPFIRLTPTDVISKFTDILTPSFMSELAFLKLLLYPTVIWVFRRRFEGMSQVPGETARSSRTFSPPITSWNLWTLFEICGSLIASSTNTRNLRWASFALPYEPKIDDLTLTYAPRMQWTNSSVDWFSLAISACVRPSDLSAMKKSNCLSTFAYHFLWNKWDSLWWLFHPHRRIFFFQYNRVNDLLPDQQRSHKW